MYNALGFLCLIAALVYLKLLQGPAITASLTFFTLCYLLFEEKIHIKTQYLLIALIIIMVIIIAVPLIPGFAVNPISINQGILIYIITAFLYRIPSLNSFRNIDPKLIILCLIWSVVAYFYLKPNYFQSHGILLIYVICIELVLRLLLLNIFLKYGMNNYIASLAVCGVAFVIMAEQLLPINIINALLVYQLILNLIYINNRKIEVTLLLHYLGMQVIS